MARGRNVQDPTILKMALVGYQFEKQKIEDRITEIQSQLKGKHTSSVVESERPKGKRVLSEGARKRIAAAQKKRWAEHRKRKAQESAA